MPESVPDDHVASQMVFSDPVPFPVNHSMFLSFFTLLLLHPIHETVSELEWNEQSKSTEVALRLHGLDEQWILKQPVIQPPADAASPFKIEAEDEAGEPDKVSRRAMNYLGRHYQFRGFGRPEAIPTYHWVGRKEEGAHVWWYFEVKSDDETRPTSIDVSLLFDHNTNYTHRILFLEATRRQSATLTRRNHRIAFPHASSSTDAIESRP